MDNQFRFYNTLTRKIETVIPHEDGKIKMYTCGPTVYHFAHIGNLRTYIMEDILVRGLSYVGYDVKRVMNITDVGHLSCQCIVKAKLIVHCVCPSICFLLYILSVQYFPAKVTSYL